MFTELYHQNQIEYIRLKSSKVKSWKILCWEIKKNIALGCQEENFMKFNSKNSWGPNKWISLQVWLARFSGLDDDDSDKQEIEIKLNGIQWTNKPHDSKSLFSLVIIVMSVWEKKIWTCGWAEIFAVVGKKIAVVKI